MEILKRKVLELAKKRALANNNVFLVDLYKIDKDFYDEYMEYFDEYPRLSRLRPQASKELEQNVRVMKKKKVATVAVYYCGGKYRELITDVPICGVKEYIDVNPITGENVEIDIVYGDEEPLFFVYSDSKNLFDHGCSHLQEQVLHPITKGEYETYCIIHNNRELYKLQLESTKAEAISEYNKLLLAFATADLELEKTYQKQRRQIIHTSINNKNLDKTQQM